MTYRTYLSTRFAIPLLLILTTSILPIANVQAAVSNANGCAQLTTLVTQSVTRTLQPDYARPVAFALAASGEWSSCGTAAATVSRAFSAALQDLGIHLHWNGVPGAAPGDYCKGRFLDQCFPGRGGPGDPYPVVGDPEITLAWATVAATVRQVMPFGGQSDIVYFQPERFAASLSLSLDVTLRAPKFASHLLRLQ